MRPIATYTVVPSLPEALSRLTDVAYNIRWAWDHESIELFRRMDPQLWEDSQHNPVRMLGKMNQRRLDQLAEDEGFLAHLDRVLRSLEDYMTTQAQTAWYDRTFGGEEFPQIAYFSFEFGLTESIPNYSGGLGILAGDHLKAASDLNVPLVGVGLLYQQGYFRQYLNIDGWQQERYPENDFYTMPLRLMADEDGEPIRISVQFPGRDIFAQIWRVQVGRVELYLLDTNVPANSNRADQDLTDQLYGGDRENRIKQEILLGIGGLRALYALGIEPAVCHMNEGHSAFMALERARILMERYKINFTEAWAITSGSNVFTTHTPVPAGNDYFAPELMKTYFTDYAGILGLDLKSFMALGRFNAEDGEEHFCMTILALRASAYNNGVSRLHGEVARKMWTGIYPEVPLDETPITSITNGIHTYSWVARDMGQLYDRYLGPRWREDPTDIAVWQRAYDIPDEELWRTHERLRERLVFFSRKQLIAQLENRGMAPAEIKMAREVLDPEALTIGFARRFATYKRATLLLRDATRFASILCNDQQPIQFLFAGKAHPHDNYGKEFIRQLIHFARATDCRHRIVFLEDYDMVIARYLTQGVDVWLNTPRRPLEASGTSGMKGILNGVLNLSILDGWWAEAYNPHVGWAIGRGEEYEDAEAQNEIEANALYDLIEKDLLPAFYTRGPDGLPREWIRMMKATISELSPVFSTARMVRDYTQMFYYSALSQYRLFSENDYARGMEYAAWEQLLRSQWGTLDLDSITATTNKEVRVGEVLEVSAEAFLGDIHSNHVRVQLFEGMLDAEGNISTGRAHTMAYGGLSDRGGGWHRYHTTFQSEHSGRHGYTIRVIPNHPDMAHVLRLGLVVWA